MNRTRKAGVLVITEGVYGMTGDLAKLDAICELKDKYDARLMIDDAHGFGVMGPTGRGTAEYFGVTDRVDVYFGTFAKAFASIGGVSAAPEDVVEWIKYNARSQVFAKALPMVYVKSLQKTLELVRDGAAVARDSSRSPGASPQASAPSDSASARSSRPSCRSSSREEGTPPWRWTGYAFSATVGVFVTGIMYPVIPKNYVEFRIVPTASHEDEDIELDLEAFRRLRDEKRLDLAIDWSGIDKLYGRA